MNANEFINLRRTFTTPSLQNRTTMSTDQSQPTDYSHLIVGVTTRKGSEEWTSQHARNYLNTLNSYGVAPVILAPDTVATIPDTSIPGGKTFAPDALGRLDPSVLNHLHGLILSGGGDVDPRYFGAELDGAEVDSIDRARDELELNLARAALEMDIPLFGICRGCQVLNVAAGGGMIQHFDNHRSPKDTTAFHDVVVTPHSRFHNIVGTDQFPVNTFHHQGMDRASIAPIFVPSAIAAPDSWLVEAYESPSHAWVVGVQWHPERTFELTDPHIRLWQSFLTACTTRAAKLVA